MSQGQKNKKNSSIFKQRKKLKNSEAETNIVPLGLFVWKPGGGQVARNQAGNFALYLPSDTIMTRAELKFKGLPNIKRNASELVPMTQMNLEPIIQSEVSQKEKDKYCILTYILEKAMAPHSSTLAWKIPWTEEPGGLQSMGSLRVGHD